MALENHSAKKLETELVDILIHKGLHISFAESCTGGMCAQRLVNVANASKVFDVSFVTYANEAKIKYLGISPDVISEVGVVSEKVARQMAAGVAKQAECEVGVGVTGIAGPSGGTDEKPVGTVCFGFFVDGEVKTFTKHFGNIGRNNVRTASADFVFETLVSLLSDSERG